MSDPEDEDAMPPLLDSESDDEEEDEGVPPAVAARGSVKRVVSLTLVPRELSGRYILRKVNPDGQEDTRHTYFEAVEDDNGGPLFRPENIFLIVGLALVHARNSLWKFFIGRDAQGGENEVLLRGKVGRQMLHLLQTVHYIFNVSKRFTYDTSDGARATAARTFMVRGLRYRFQEFFSKEGYSREASIIMQALSQSLRFKVGDRWVSIPERAFGITSETKGRYDGDLAEEYTYHDGTTGTYDCQNRALRDNNEQGFNIPGWYARVNQAIDPSPYREVRLVSAAWFLLILEDGIIFNLFRRVAIWKKIPVILVCPHGKPDNDTIAWVWKTCMALGILAYGICDFNVGGVDVLNAFGDTSQERGWAERSLYHTMVRWIALRPSQLKNFTTGGTAASRKLSHPSFKKAFRFFGKIRNSRLDNHLKEKTQWIENGGARKEQRRGEMKAMKKMNYGLDTQLIEDDVLVKDVEDLLLRIKDGVEKDKHENYCWV